MGDDKGKDKGQGQSGQNQGTRPSGFSNDKHPAWFEKPRSEGTPK